ncbi:hypothetical protein FACS1894186_3950 [Alphaproteobacteria bacterium]|nr:hypothetical protein FACS1894186_3950 [Alphaproteobacteria bacterium]
MPGIIDILVLGVIALILARRVYQSMGTGTSAIAHRLAQPKKIVDFSAVRRSFAKRGQSMGMEKVAGQIRLYEPSFTEAAFADMAKRSFGVVVAALAQGDKEALKTMLSPRLYEKFEAEIDRRAKAEELVEIEIEGFDGITISDASFSGHNAEITACFATRQIQSTYAADGRVVAGNPAAAEKITDIWTFARDYGSPKSKWILTATRSPHDQVA